MIRLAVVGDIGSGKSYVAKQFGYPVFNADVEVSKIYKNKSGFALVQVDQMLPSGEKSFDQVRGIVMSQYQQQLEATWMQSLRDKYSVVIHKKTLKKIKKELKK